MMVGTTVKPLCFESLLGPHSLRIYMYIKTLYVSNHSYFKIKLQCYITQLYRSAMLNLPIFPPKKWFYMTGGLSCSK